MIEIISVSRILTDYLWGYKFLSVVHSIVVMLLALLMILYTKKTNFKACNTDKYSLLFLFMVVIALAKNMNESTMIEFMKFFSYLSFYFVGRVIPSNLKHTRILGWFSLVALVILTFFALTGLGYTTWGYVTTFTGGYYFKTDLAIASLIFLTLAFVTLQKNTLLAISLICAGYLVFKSNARIALPLVILIPAFIMMTLKGKINSINVKTVTVLLTATVLGMLLFLLVDFRGSGMLGFDFSNPFSAANTQGRSVIWAALLNAYSEAPLLEKVVGMGLDADSRATTLFSASLQLEGVRAHNSYLYLLVGMGVAGSMAFYWMLFSAFSKAPFLLQQKDIKQKTIPTISCSFLILFLWLSLTTEIIIRPQLMVLFFFFTGLHVQSYLKLKKDQRRNMRALANRT